MAMKKSKITIQGNVVVDNEWCKQIKPDDSLWCIETDKDGKKMIQLQITKLKGNDWWDCVWAGGEKVKYDPVYPSDMKMSDFDPEMRAQIEKEVFDKRQKQQGKPTSDELDKQEKIKAYMEAHPEMDFSNTKFQ